MPLIFYAQNRDMAALKPDNSDPAMGGLVIFNGRVRGFNRHKPVAFLDYQAHDALALSLFSEIESEAKRRFQVFSITAAHRLGRVEVGQDAVLIIVTAGHRHEAFLACRFVIDELKRSLPIWRKEVYEDGSFSFEQTGGCVHTDDKLAETMRPTAAALSARHIKYLELRKKRVLLVGAGGLGCPLAINLAALGIGHLTICDGDVVEAGNLARQFVYKNIDIGASKSNLLKLFINERNQACNIDEFPLFIDDNTALNLACNYDLLIDATDCKYTKKMLKRVAFLKAIPLVSGSVYQSEGEVSVYKPQALGACLLCFEGDGQDQAFSCATTGVLTHACTMVAAVMAEKALAVLSATFLGQCEMTIVDALGVRIKTLTIAKDEHCYICGLAEPKSKDPRKALVRFAS